MAEKRWPTWIVSYGLDGSQWSIDVVAPSPEDAKRRLAAAAQWGTVDGELMMEIPVTRGGFLVPLVCWVRNLFARIS